MHMFEIITAGMLGYGAGQLGEHFIARKVKRDRRAPARALDIAPSDLSTPKGLKEKLKGTFNEKGLRRFIASLALIGAGVGVTTALGINSNYPTSREKPAVHVVINQDYRSTPDQPLIQSAVSGIVYRNPRLSYEETLALNGTVVNYPSSKLKDIPFGGPSLGQAINSASTFPTAPNVQTNGLGMGNEGKAGVLVIIDNNNQATGLNNSNLENRLKSAGNIPVDVLNINGSNNPTLRALTESTGGRYFDVNAANLPEQIKTLNNDLNPSGVKESGNNTNRSWLLMAVALAGIGAKVAEDKLHTPAHLIRKGE